MAAPAISAANMAVILRAQADGFRLIRDAEAKKWQRSMDAQDDDAERHHNREYELADALAMLLDAQSEKAEVEAAIEKAEARLRELEAN